MPELSYPSEVFPGPPGVTIDAPDTWAPVRVGGTLLACRRIDSDHGFAPNVVVRGFQRTGDFTMREALAELRAFVDEQPEGHVDEPFELTLGEVPFLGVNVSWSDPDIGTIVQIHLFAGSRRGRIVDLVQATGSVGGGDAQSAYAEVQQVLQTIRVTK
ncbi:hypothetical protein DUHN55_09830 [Helicobacter pylori]|uniref:hypothetical protein n=1 Tax=unclassified Janibacter TaxID=2649294 RepID=UPI0020CF85F9|nr:hypothetical protein [Janibacter sp. CX7]UTT66121.1 hypothetical protein NMQ01_15745 [Janibacter sp. CX7]